MAENNDILNKASEYLQKDDIAFKIEKDSLLFEISIDNIDFSISMAYAGYFLVMFAKIPINIEDRTLEKTILLLNYINSRIPFGSFEYDLELKTVFLRASIPVKAEELTESMLNHIINFSLFNIENFYSILNGVASDLIAFEDAIKRVRSKFEDEVEQLETQD